MHGCQNYCHCLAIPSDTFFVFHFLSEENSEGRRKARGKHRRREKGSPTPTFDVVCRAFASWPANPLANISLPWRTAAFVYLQFTPSDNEDDFIIIIIVILLSYGFRSTEYNMLWRCFVRYFHVQDMISRDFVSVYVYDTKNTTSGSTPASQNIIIVIMKSALKWTHKYMIISALGTSDELKNEIDPKFNFTSPPPSSQHPASQLHEFFTLS